MFMVTEFQGLDAGIIVKALQILEEQGKGALMGADASDPDEIGFKFV
jgi:hypothetical protein